MKEGFLTCIRKNISYFILSSLYVAVGAVPALGLSTESPVPASAQNTVA
jgi:hypothetical protein